MDSLLKRIHSLKSYLDSNGYSGNIYALASAPTADEDTNAGYDKFDLVLDTATDKIYECKSTTVSSAVWEDTKFTLGGITENGVELYIVASEASHLALDDRIGDVIIRSDEKKLYRKTAAAAGDMTDYTEVDVASNAISAAAGAQADADSAQALADALVNYLGDGVLQDGTLGVNAGVPEDFDTTQTAYYRLAGIQYSKEAEAAVSFTAAHTINTAADVGDFFGAILIQVDAAGTLSTKVVSEDQVYTTEEDAIAALPDADADNVALGYIVIGANTDVAWTANTDDMTAASDCASVTIVDATALSVPSAE